MYVIVKERGREREGERDTDKCILFMFHVKAWIEPAIPSHLAYSIETKALS